MTGPEFLALQTALRGRYVLDRELGRGGMGVVFLARDVALDRSVAIKLLPAALAANPGLRARFLQEARTAAGLSHPNIVPIHAVEEHGEVVCFVMAWIPGQTLAQRVETEGPLPLPEVSRLVQEVAWALAYAHERGVIHRDIKPENILLERGTGRALLTDFGIARLADATGNTPPGDVVGTARSMSPEQAAGEPVDGRSDVYSLGVTAFYALTGRFPFEAGSAAGFLTAHLNSPAPPVASLRSGIPPALARAVDRALAKTPEARFPSAASMAEVVSDAGAQAPAVPVVLERVVRETSSFGVDLMGYLSLALVAVLAQLLTWGHDFLGFERFYTFAIALVLTSLTALRGMSLARILREAIREGWDVEDLARAFRQTAESTSSSAPEPPRLGRTLLLYGVGLTALVGYWFGMNTLGQRSISGLLAVTLAVTMEFVGLITPIALGRWFGGILERPRAGKPGFLSRFLLAKVRWLFRLLGRRRTSKLAALGAGPTEVALADATRALYQALPPGDREVLGDVLGTIGKLEQEAEAQRLRLTRLDRAAAEAGRGLPARDALQLDLSGERRAAEERLTTAVSALESVRLELLRLRAGLGAGPGLTEALEGLRQVEAGVDAVLEVQQSPLPDVASSSPGVG